MDTTQWLTPREACQIARVALPTLRRAIRSGVVPAYTISTTGRGGKRVRIRLADLDQWLSATPAPRTQTEEGAPS
jgi:excisionase family DNA binding protein